MVAAGLVSSMCLSFLATVMENQVVHLLYYVVLYCIVFLPEGLQFVSATLYHNIH
jgi:hypothetical protein